MRNICIISETINQGQLVKGEVLMKWRIRIAIVSLCLIMLMLNGCGLFSLKDDLSPEERVSTSAAKTLEVLHGVETIVAMTLSAGNVEQATPDSTEPEKTQAPTNTPVENQAQTATTTIAPSATRSIPVVSVSMNTNCRTGPNVVFDLLGILSVGKEAEVVARSADGSYWVIRNPSGSGTCWLWGYYATVDGPLANLPVWDPPPTPTAQATITPTSTPTKTPTLTLTSTPVPSTYKTGPLSITQTYMADFDEGIMIIGSASDLWFEAVTSTQKYLSPQNGARFAIWGSSAPGMYDCLNASLSTARIPISSAPVGTYVCYLTNQGRPGTFRVNGLSSDVMQILSVGFTTWNTP